jgi:hypothetical protein
MTRFEIDNMEASRICGYIDFLSTQSQAVRKKTIPYIIDERYGLREAVFRVLGNVDTDNTPPGPEVPYPGPHR